MACKEFKYPMIVTNLIYSCMPVYLYILVFIFDLGIVGIGLSRSIANFSGALIMLFLIKRDIK